MKARLYPLLLYPPGSLLAFFFSGTRHDGTTVNKVPPSSSLAVLRGSPSCSPITIRYTRVRPIVQERNNQPKGPTAFSVRSSSLLLSLAMSVLHSTLLPCPSFSLSLSSSLSLPLPTELPILISIMTRNGCWRECSSLSVPAVPVVYLSGTRAAPFHPGEKHGEAETAASSLFFYARCSPRSSFSESAPGNLRLIAFFQLRRVGASVCAISQRFRRLLFCPRFFSLLTLRLRVTNSFLRVLLADTVMRFR